MRSEAGFFIALCSMVSIAKFTFRLDRGVLGSGWSSSSCLLRTDLVREGLVNILLLTR